MQFPYFSWKLPKKNFFAVEIIFISSAILHKLKEINRGITVRKSLQKFILFKSEKKGGNVKRF